MKLIPIATWIEGGKTGITAVVTGLLFFVSVFFAPIFASIPPWATGGALVVVGSLMIRNVRDINWDYIGDALPAFLTILIIPLSYKYGSPLWNFESIPHNILLALLMVSLPEWAHISSSTVLCGSFEKHPTNAFPLQTTTHPSHGSFLLAVLFLPGCKCQYMWTGFVLTLRFLQKIHSSQERCFRRTLGISLSGPPSSIGCFDRLGCPGGPNTKKREFLQCRKIIHSPSGLPIAPTAPLLVYC